MNIGTRIKNAFAGMWEDTQAVSPIVATLVLVVVAITGAAAVGTIMGTFSSDVSDQSNTEDLTSASSTEILVAGSTTVQPVSELIAEAYMDDHAGVKITVQGGGSGAGVSSAGLGIVDIGAASRAMKTTEEEDYPDMEVYPVGGSAVVLIAHKDAAVTGPVKRTEVMAAYENNSYNFANATITTVYQRSDASGTEDTFVDWLGEIDIDEDNIGGAIGNAGVLAAVKGDATSMGFVDYGFAANDDGVQILGIIDNGRSENEYLNTSITSKNLKKAIKDDDDTKYPTGKAGPDDVKGLTRPLNYMTNGEPNPMVQAFITYAQSPGATEHFGTCGYFAYTEIA